MVQVTEVSVEGRVVGLEAGHPAVLDALDEFFADLKSVPELKVAERDAAGSGGKGVLAELIVGLGGTDLSWRSCGSCGSGLSATGTGH